jgi:RHS repeat-associated protein
MTQRNIGTTYNYSYNAENKLTDVSIGTTASFTYDGDGNRVKTVVGGTTTVFLGNYYERTSSTVKKYYFAGTIRIAMRENSILIFLSGDHLGSTSLVYKTDTGLVIKKLYKPWGETRYTSTTMPTRFQFTGQYREVSLGGADGLYYFVARWYDQALGRFLQADTIIPKPGDIQGWDRYAYSLNNPVFYSDASGHWPTIPVNLSFNSATFIQNTLNPVINVVNFVLDIIDLGEIQLNSQDVATAYSVVSTTVDLGAEALDTFAVSTVIDATVAGSAVAPEAYLASELAVEPLIFAGNVSASFSTLFSTVSELITGDTGVNINLTSTQSGVNIQGVVSIGNGTSIGTMTTIAGWRLPQLSWVSYIVQTAAVANDFNVFGSGSQIPFKYSTETDYWIPPSTSTSVNYLPLQAK